MYTNLKCPMCSGQFNSQQELDEHAKQAHSNQVSEELQEHSVMCSKCGLKTKSVENLKDHEQHHSMNG